MTFFLCITLMSSIVLNITLLVLIRRASKASETISNLGDRNVVSVRGAARRVSEFDGEANK